MGKSKKAFDAHYTTGLEDLVLNVNQIAVGKFPAHELYFVRLGDDEMGPIWSQDLKSFLEQNPDFVTKITVAESDQYANGEDCLWEAVYDLPYFQRRKPQIVKGETEEMDVYEDLYVLKNGQKLGPYTFVTLLNALRKHEILFTDNISFDKGHSWKKIHEIKDLDRRSLHDDLPETMPDTAILKNFSFGQKNQKEDNSVLTNLALISGFRKGSHNTEIEGSGNGTSNETNPNANKNKVVFFAVFIVVFALGALLIPAKKKSSSANNTQTQQKVQEATPKASSQKVKSVRKPARERPAPRRNIERTVPNSRKSFRESRAYKRNQRQNKRKMMDNALTEEEIKDDYQYDDGDDPVEADDVRSQLDKETIDPEENYDDYPEDNADYEEDAYAEGEEDIEDVVDQDLEY